MAVSGFAALALEIVWFRVLVQFLPATSYAFTTMLATVLGRHRARQRRGLAQSGAPARLERRARLHPGRDQPRRAVVAGSPRRHLRGRLAYRGSRPREPRPPFCRRRCSWAMPSRWRSPSGRTPGPPVAARRVPSAISTRRTCSAVSPARWRAASCCSRCLGSRRALIALAGLYLVTGLVMLVATGRRRGALVLVMAVCRRRAPRARSVRGRPRAAARARRTHLLARGRRADLGQHPHPGVPWLADVPRRACTRHRTRQRW